MNREELFEGMDGFTKEAMKVSQVMHIIEALNINFDLIEDVSNRADSIGPILIPHEYRDSSKEYRQVADMSRYLKKANEIWESEIRVEDE